MYSADEALTKLHEGNKRFVEGVPTRAGWVTQAKREQLAEAQEPFAVILGCSDSRVPVEILFDQGLGDLFVIRVAGNVVAPSQIGSIEFAATAFGTRLVVVLGHTNCGAVVATVDELLQPAPERSPNLAAIVEFVKPSVEPLVRDEQYASDKEKLVHDAVRANVRASMHEIEEHSTVLKGLRESDGLKIVGAEYNLQTGEVEFFESPS